MPNIITVRKRREIKINRNAKGDGVVRVDPEAADVLERLLCEAEGDLSVKELASSMIKYAANDTIIRIEEETE